MTETKEIKVPDLDLEKIAAELERQLPFLKEQLRRLEEAKKVSPETMAKVITI